MENNTTDKPRISGQEFFDARIARRTMSDGREISLRFDWSSAKHEVKVGNEVLYFGISEEEAVGIFYHHDD